MRLVMDSLIALMLVAVLGGLLLYQRHQDRALADLRFVHASLAQLHEQAVYQAAMRVSTAQDQSQQAFPAWVSAQWFSGTLPVNLLVGADRPWIDLAPDEDLADHPPDPVVRDPGQAGFWYNPNTGVFRARVEPGNTDRQTLDLYNQVNSSALIALPRSQDPARQPLAMLPRLVTATTVHASLDRAEIAQPTQQQAQPPHEQPAPEPPHPEPASTSVPSASAQTLRALQDRPADVSPDAQAVSQP